MKRILVLLLAMTIMFVGCGGGSNSNDKTTKKETVEKKKAYNLSTQEGMLEKMADIFHLTVPSQLSFIEIKKKNGENKIVFKAENITEEDLAKVEEWYKNECQRFRDEEYKETVINDNKKMMGMVFNNFSYMKKTENSTATKWSWNSISLYSNYKADEKSYELTITP